MFVSVWLFPPWWRGWLGAVARCCYPAPGKLISYYSRIDQNSQYGFTECVTLLHCEVYISYIKPFCIQDHHFYENQMKTKWMKKNQNPNNHFLLSKRERESWEDHTENAGLPHFILLHFTVLHRYHVFHKLKGFGKSALNKSIGTIFPNSICSLHVSGSHLGNSCNTTSNVCIITICFGNPWSVISYCNCLGTPQTMPI